MRQARKKIEKKSIFKDVLQNDPKAEERFVKTFGGGVLHQAELKSVPVISVEVPSSQSRKYFDEESLEKLSKSIKKHGILEPLVVRRLDEEKERFLLIAGERRLRAAKRVGLPLVPVNIISADHEKAQELALIENLQRDDLNPLEETEGILDLLALRLQCDREGVITTLNQLHKSKRGLADNVVSPETQQFIEEVVQELGGLSAESFRTHRLPLLRLPGEILDTLRRGQIEYTKAKLIAKVKDESARKALLGKAVAHKMSIRDLRNELKVLVNRGSGKPRKTHTQARELLQVFHEEIGNGNGWKDPKVTEILAEALDKLREHLQGG